jgi:hypothetical protein
MVTASFSLLDVTIVLTAVLGFCQIHQLTIIMMSDYICQIFSIYQGFYGEVLRPLYKKIFPLPLQKGKGD